MYYFIVNPNSRSGLGNFIWQEVKIHLKNTGVKYQVFFTKYQKHATKIAAALTQDLQEHTIVVLGGDGTINEVVNGIRDFSKIILGYIPTGSSNDFARAFDLPTDPGEALRVILNPRQIQQMDIGTLNYRTKSRHFAVSTGLGFDAAICHAAMISRLKLLLNKLKLGKLTYVCLALERLIYDQPVQMTVTIDQQKPITFQKVYFTAVMNTRFEGGGFQFCPKANAGDGILDVIVVSDLPKWKIPILFPTAYWGKHIHFKGIHTFRGKQIIINAKRALPVHTDGEPIFQQRNMAVSLAEKQLRIITG